MRFFLFSLLLATPAFAHPAALTHTHSPDWVLTAAFALVGVAALRARRRVLAARRGK